MYMHVNMSWIIFLYVMHLAIIHLSTEYDDLFDVKSELIPVAPKWKDIGLALRLDFVHLNQIQKDNRNCQDCLTEMLDLWLKKAYNTEKFGQPSWRLLIQAIEHPAGGHSCALAEKIAKKFGGTNSLCLC